jgi:hypothetical protein
MANFEECRHCIWDQHQDETQVNGNAAQTDIATKPLGYWLLSTGLLRDMDSGK